jgi:hypothetical protein
MDRSFVEAIVEHCTTKVHEVDGQSYSDKELHPVFFDPRPEPLRAYTLTALKHYMEANIDGVDSDKPLAHVKGPCAVDLIGPVAGESRKRTCLMTLEPVETPRFRFGEWQDPEQFLINLMSLFACTPDLSEVTRIAGNMRAEAVATLTDDGITQIVTVKRGVALACEINLPNPLTLAPYRTFRELEQPASSFLFRVQGGGDGKMPKCALFEADGAGWKLDAISRIAQWIQGNITGLHVIA